MNLRNIIEASKYDTSKSQMKQWFIQCISKYFPQHKPDVGNDWEMPTFLIKTDKKRAGWFQCSFKGDIVVNPVITVNPDFVHSTMRNIVFHETIHYVQANVYGYTKYRLAQNGGHDSFFIEMMNKINSGEGQGFVTVKQDSQQLSGNKEFWVYGVKTTRGEFGFLSTAKQNPLILNHLKQGIGVRYVDVYEFKTAELKYKIGSFTKRSLKLGVPMTQPTDEELSKYSVKNG